MKPPSASDYGDMARHADYIVAMTYDSGLKAPEYESWMEEQPQASSKPSPARSRVLASVAPQPPGTAKVLIGLPGFHTRTKAHDPDIETVTAGAPGILRALARLQGHDRKSLNCFQGAAMFTHDGGPPESIYARYDKDWRSWLRDWLSQSRQ